MEILILNPFHSGSHKKWAEGLKKHSKHNITLWTLRGKYWKWRMHGAAVSFQQRLLNENFKPDLVLATDMLDLAQFRGLVERHLPDTKFAVYFHENQLSYPWQNDGAVQDEQNSHYAYINYSSALAADQVWFNSKFHLDDFLGALPKFLKAFPDERNLATIEQIASKSDVLYLGSDLKQFDTTIRVKKDKTTFLWNHRHEHDKNPEAFFQALFTLADAGEEFSLIVLGESFAQTPEIFQIAKEKLKDNIIHWGFVESEREYHKLLGQSDYLPVTSNHDFFGQSVIEAAYCGVFPILPNRLVYPEHFSQKKAWFYDQASHFHSLLMRAIRETPSYDAQADLHKYDWSRQIDLYDAAFDSLFSA